ncbi:MAG TPA: twin-arginine translocase TatA/TatE family subunit [bacterium]
MVLLLFGGKRLPELARSLGKGLAEFRRATQDVQRELNAPLNEPPPPVKPTPPSTATSDSEPPKTEVHANPAAQPRTSETPPGPDSGRS